MKLFKTFKLYFLLSFFLVTTPYLSKAQEFEDWKAWAEVMSELCECPVTIYTSYQDSKNNEVGAHYDGSSHSGNNGQTRNTGNVICPDNSPCYSTMTDTHYNPVDTEPGYQNDPNNEPEGPCYSCDCDPLFCIGGDPNVPQPKDYDHYGPPPSGPAYNRDPYYYTWDNNWYYNNGGVPPTDPTKFSNEIKADPNGYGYYFQIIFGQKYVYYYSESTSVTYQANTVISPPCNFLEAGRTNSRVNADCPKIWQFSIDDGRWYYKEDGDWHVFILDESTFDGYTYQDYRNYFSDHQVEAEQIYASIKRGGPYGLLPTAEFMLPMFFQEIMANEIRALEVINARDNHGWPKWVIVAKAYWNLLSGTGHFVIDVAGMYPVIGEAADVVNGLWYTLEGNGVDAALSFGSAVPVAGWVSTTGKWVGKALKLSNNSVVLLKLVKKSNGLFDFGGRKTLRTVLDIKDKNMHAHHIIPWSFNENQLIQKAARKGFHPNDLLNGVELKKYTKVEFPDGDHAYHPAYDKFVETKIQRYIDGKNGIDNISDTQANDYFINDLIPELRGYIAELDDYPGNLNDYFKNVINPQNNIPN